MLINGQKAEFEAVMNAAYELCAAARTAPKACGIDHIETCIVTAEEKDQLAEEMRKIANYDEKNFMVRDAGNVDASSVVVLIGVTEKKRGLGKQCSLCHFDGCAECAEANGVCVFDMIDLGIALGSASAVAADYRMDNRIMFTAGKAAASLKLLGDCNCIMGIPLSVSGKNVFFDREAKRK